jgi:quercetin dioxygenase-like cupin family protein
VYEFRATTPAYVEYRWQAQLQSMGTSITAQFGSSPAKRCVDSHQHFDTARRAEITLERIDFVVDGENESHRMMVRSLPPPRRLGAGSREDRMAAHFIQDIATDITVPSEGTLSKKLHSDGVRLVIFAFDAGQQLTEHTTPRPAILQVHQGRLQVTAGDSTHEASPDSWLSLDPNQPHSVTALEPSIMLLTLLPLPAKDE